MKVKMTHTFLIPLVFFCVTLLSCSKNAGGTTDLVEEKIEPKATLAELKTDAVGSITMISAAVTSTVTSDGNSSITSRGVCWSETASPTINGAFAEASSVKGSGEFTAVLNGLTENTVYYVRAYATNSAGTAYGNELTFTTIKGAEPIKPVVFLDSTTFDSHEKFVAHWNELYPWGSDHNGSARMYSEQVTLEADGVLLIKADRTEVWEGYSTADPWLRIFYHSGAIHYNKHITVTNEFPEWEISGDFQAPTMVGSWPAFWITGAWSWPPESDIMEFKGNNTNWQNTVTGPNWENTSWQTTKTAVANAEGWHNYKLIMKKVSDTNVQLLYYIDNKLMATHYADFVGKPFWLIINMQMEGASGGHASGPQQALFRARNVYVAALPAE